MEYNFQEIERKWQAYWEAHKTFKASGQSGKPKYYALDMFPYPSGAGLHVGHPLGYIASDIISRYHRHKGFNVLHPMGFDAFGLPAEQYAIASGKHPAETTRENIARYIGQLKLIGFSYDWDRMVTTSDPAYYKWTQWIFLKLFNSWYDTEQQKARLIGELESLFEKQGSEEIQAVHDEHENFTAEDWKKFDNKNRSRILMCYRLAYSGYAWVNWCEGLGTVLANDEVKDGVSERGGHPVERRQMRNWFLRITAYAERLLNDLDMLDWSSSMKEMQANWIGKSEGASVRFRLQEAGDRGQEAGSREQEDTIEVFTTRPDTIFGVTFMVLAPESEWVTKLTTPGQQEDVNAYVTAAKNRSERERQANVDKVSGVFTGSHAIHPFTGNPVPIWIGDYVLAGYGTGVVMAVPGHDARDFRFAKHFGLPVVRVITGPDGAENELTEAHEAKEGKLVNSDWLNGLEVKDAIRKAIDKIAEQGIGAREVNYRLRDANFSRQRYWGEPFPIYYKDDIPVALPENELPLELPPMEDFKPTGRPESPLAKLDNWKKNGHPLETDTMPGFAGSSWYFLRYMDANNAQEFASKEALEYWKDVDLYIGGTEHAVGHLLYSRFWHKVLFDYGYVPTTEPFRKLVNQGMIQGRSNFIYRVKGTNTYVSYNLKDQYDTSPIHVDVNLVDNDVLDVEKLKASSREYAEGEFVMEYPEIPVAPTPALPDGEGDHICDAGLDMVREEVIKYGYMTADSGIYKVLRAYQLELRNGPTPAEVLLWEMLRKDQLGTHFRRQHIIGKFIVDFVCLKHKLVIEVDGPIHDFQTDKDKARDEELATLGYTVIRFKNDEVFNNIDNIKTRIVSHLSSSPSHGGGQGEAPDAYIEELLPETNTIADNFKSAGIFLCGAEVEKMSKSKLNVVNPDDICYKYGADTLRLYEMFLGPIEQHKPWNTNGIEGVHRFLNKLWKACIGADGNCLLNDEVPNPAEQKALHKTIKKITADIENLSLNTCVSAFMILLNELNDLKCQKKQVFRDFIILLSPFTPHLAEELWEKLGNPAGSLSTVDFPLFNSAYLVESAFEYPVSFNGKVRFKLEFPLDMDPAEIEKEVLANEQSVKWLEGKSPKKIIVVKGRIINLVL